MTQRGFDFTGPGTFDPAAMAIAPSEHPQARETSALAAVANLSKRASQNAKILALLKDAGAQGLSDMEIHRITGIPRASICARRGFDLKPILEPAGRYQDTKTGSVFTRWRVKDASR